MILFLFLFLLNSNTIFGQDFGKAKVESAENKFFQNSELTCNYENLNENGEYLNAIVFSDFGSTLSGSSLIPKELNRNFIQCGDCFQIVTQGARARFRVVSIDSLLQKTIQIENRFIDNLLLNQTTNDIEYEIQICSYFDDIRIDVSSIENNTTWLVVSQSNLPIEELLIADFVDNSSENLRRIRRSPRDNRFAFVRNTTESLVRLRGPNNEISQVRRAFDSADLVVYVPQLVESNDRDWAGTAFQRILLTPRAEVEPAAIVGLLSLIAVFVTTVVWLIVIYKTRQTGDYMQTDDALG